MADFKTAIQLYTVRGELEEDFTGTIGKLAEMGFQGVEFAHKFGGLPPDELSAFLDEKGLSVTSVYYPVDGIAGGDDRLYSYCRRLGCGYLTGGLPGMADEKNWPAAVEKVKRASGACRERGFAFLYHNHHQEFAKIKGEYALDILMRETEEDGVEAEFDTGWIKKGGEDPAAYIRKYAGRTPLLHVKDITADGEVTELGGGLVDFPELLRAARECGVEWLVYEQDSSSMGALKSAETSLRKLRELGV